MLGGSKYSTISFMFSALTTLKVTLNINDKIKEVDFTMDNTRDACQNYFAMTK